MLKKTIIIAMTTFTLSATPTSNKADDSKLAMYACGITRVAFVKELTKAFEAERNITISLNKKGGVGFVLKGLHNRKIEIGAGCRAPFKTNIEKDIWGTQVAWGALGFIVNEKNNLENLSMENIKKILLGEISNWKEIGGENHSINLYLREGKKSGVGSTARKLMFHDANISFSKDATRVKSSGPIRKAILSDRYGFAIDDVTSASLTEGVRLLKVDNIEPNKENILSEKYKLRRAFYIYLSKEPTRWSRQFLDFTLSKKGQKIISKTGTANLEEASGKHDELNLMFQKLKFQLKTK